MVRSNFGAVRLPLLAAAVLASFAVPLSAQVVEKGRTIADLIASHPCDTGLENRIARVTDCDSATDFGDGDGAFQCWAYCDGSAPWTNLSIGGGGGGGEATSVQGSATLPATCAELDLYQDTNSGGTEFYVCTATDTWTKAGTGDGTIGGTLTATDNLPICTDGTGGSTIGACTVAAFPASTAGAPAISFGTDTNTGIYWTTEGYVQVATDGAAALNIGPDRVEVQTNHSLLGTGNATFFGGFLQQVEANTAGSGAPNVLAINENQKFFTNEGSTAANYHTLPTAVAGYVYRFCVQDVDGIRIVANTSDTIRVIDKVTAGAGYIESTTIGSCVELKSINAVEWFTTSINGLWTDGTFTYDDTSLTTP